MKEKQYLRPVEVARQLGVSVKTIQRWDKAGLIKTVRTTGNQRRIPADEILRLYGQVKEPRCVLYARVSSVRQEQDGNLERQVARLVAAATERNYHIVEIIREQASSINEKRRGVKKLLTLVERQAVDVALVEYPDRLVRFGFGYLEQAFSWKGVRLEILEEPVKQEATTELVNDLLMIVTVFSGRLYGHRAKKVQKCITSALHECLQAEEASGASSQNDQTPA